MKVIFSNVVIYENKDKTISLDSWYSKEGNAIFGVDILVEQKGNIVLICWLNFNHLTTLW